MNNNLQIKGNNPFEIFNYSNLGKVRTTKSPTGEVLFCLTDVCKILGYTNPYNMVNKVNSDYLYSMEGVSTVTNQHGVTYEQVSMMNFVNNLYKLPINPSSENLRNLGLQAKQLTESRGFTVGSIISIRKEKRDERK